MGMDDGLKTESEPDGGPKPTLSGSGVAFFFCGGALQARKFPKRIAELLASWVPPRRRILEFADHRRTAGHATMSPGAQQEDVLGEGESAQDEVLQPQQGRGEAGEQDDGVEEEDEAPTHLPFAPASEVRAPRSSLAQSCFSAGEGVGPGWSTPHGHSVE